MGYILIVIGIAAIIGGVIVLNSIKETQTDKDKSENVPTGAPSESTIAEESAKRAVLTNEDVTASEQALKAKGDAFEDFVVNLLAEYRFRLLDRTQDAVSSAGVIAESCKNPDLHVQQNRGKSEIDYYIECKYRSHWTDNVVTFEEWQIDRYRQFQRDNHRKVIIALGVGGTVDAPNTFRLVPLDSMRNNKIRKIDTKYAVEPTPSALYDYINNYFTRVFRKTKTDK